MAVVQVYWFGYQILGFILDQCFFGGGNGVVSYC